MIEPSRRNFGFRNPFPVRIPFPFRNNHDNESVFLGEYLAPHTLSFDGTKVVVSFFASREDYQWTQRDVEVTFYWLENVRGVESLFSHWKESRSHFIGQMMDTMRDGLESESDRERCRGIEKFLDQAQIEWRWNPDDWTIDEWLAEGQRGMTVEDCGAGKLVTFSTKCVGFSFGASKYYLLSADGNGGCLRLSSSIPLGLEFDLASFSIDVAANSHDLPRIREQPLDVSDVFAPDRPQKPGLDGSLESPTYFVRRSARWD